MCKHDFPMGLCKECYPEQGSIDPNNPVAVSVACCNLCGHSLVLEPGGQPLGLVNQRVLGGYSSTPGNGSGALDDTHAYHFSLCEFCLDWLFSHSVFPPKVTEYNVFDGTDRNDVVIPWRSAAQRVNEDTWRTQKLKFYQESCKRFLSRRVRISRFFDWGDR